jgi:hypothetical protein
VHWLRGAAYSGGGCTAAAAAEFSELHSVDFPAQRTDIPGSNNEQQKRNITTVQNFTFTLLCRHTADMTHIESCISFSVKIPQFRSFTAVSKFHGLYRLMRNSGTAIEELRVKL